LFGHDCVIVPGFGGFIGNYTPARIDKSTSTFYPPVKQISFNRNLNNNDGLLIGKISGSSGLNYSDTRNLVEQFVEDITRKLAKAEKVVFDHIGSFINNHEGNIQFEPDRESNYHLNAYGLASFQFMPLEGYDVRKRIVRHIEKESVTHFPVRKYLWRAAVIIPLLGVLITVPLTTNLFKTKVQTTNLNPLASVEFDNNKSAIENKKSDAGLPVVQPSTETSERMPVKTEESVVRQTEPAATQPAEMFYIITGSFQSEDNANTLLKKLSDEGYSPELMKGPNGFYRVSAMKCSNLTEANLKKDSIGRKYSGTWVTRVK
jgi:nucleoid DNA-binding protein